MTRNWRPSAAPDILRLRARVLKTIRLFMEERGIMEVETPVFSRYGNTDPNLRSFCTSFASPAEPRPVRLFLNTSPEFAMKRLLAAGSGPVYQVSRVFRDGELGSHHQPEFTMLEWYRPGFDHHALMDEVEALITTLDMARAGRISYAEAFTAGIGLDPHRASDGELREKAAALGLEGTGNDRRTLLDFLFSAAAAPGLGRDRPVLIYDFPACQAALARVRADEPPVAERFELFINGLEIANGFHELTDAAEQRRRFEAENACRRAGGQPEIPLDENLLAAIGHGLPDCAGVALGLDRLLMALAGLSSIEGVLAFPAERA